MQAPTDGNAGYDAVMAGDTVQQIKDRLSIVDVVAQYVKLMRAGSSYKARCPFHSEKTPSFTVSPERGTYHCFGCGVGGDIFTFVQEVEGLDFKGALKVLAERAGVPLVYTQHAEKDDKDRLFAVLDAAAAYFALLLTPHHAAREYLHARGLTDETIAFWRVGWAPDEWRMLTAHLGKAGFTEKEMEDAGLIKRSEKGVYDKFRSRIMFPLSDSAGRVVAFSGRIFVPPPGKPADDVAKYMNSPETALFKKSRMLYGFDKAKHAIRKYDFSILVEGQMDLLMVHQAGWANAVAVSGTALTEEHLALLRRLSDNVLLALDADTAGIAAAQKSARVAVRAGMDVKVARLSSGKDPADLILSEGKEAWSNAVRTSKHIIDFLLDVFLERTKDAREYGKYVEREVLPFVALVQSPIDREHFVKRVSERLAVPDAAVRAGLLRLPKDEAGATSPVLVAAPAPRATTPARVLEAFAILAAQESAQKPQLDIAAAREALTRALGNSFSLEQIPVHEIEAARFRAEERYSEDAKVQDVFAVLVRTIEKERLQRQYNEAQTALREAEVRGDEAAAQDLLQLCTALSGALAKAG